jgi:uncharacterized protein YdaU (DUF1376 family)
MPAVPEYPALMLFTDSYLADTTHLSEAEHGRYLLLLIHMWRAPARRLPNDDAWLARKFGKTEDEVRDHLRPLLAEFFKTDGNWLYHTRLDREYAHLKARSEKQSARAKSRWTKEKGASRGNASAGNAPTPTTPKRESPNGDSYVDPPVEAAAPKPQPPTAEDVAAIWNQELGARVPRVVKLTPQRKAAAGKRLREDFGNDLEQVREFCRRIGRSPFLMGENRDGWRVDFDFAMSQSGCTKIVEGKYDSRPSARPWPPGGGGGLPADVQAERHARSRAKRLLIGQGLSEFAEDFDRQLSDLTRELVEVGSLGARAAA